MIILLLVHLTFAILIFFLCVAFITGAPFVPSVKKTAESMINLARITSEDTIYDLGSGDGRLLFLAKKQGARKSVGLEINPVLVIFTKLRILFSGAKGVQAHWKNFWTARLSDADVVFVYLLPWKMDKLAEKLKRELKPGAIIVSNSFIFPGWKIIREDTSTHVYVFETPNKG